MKHDWETKLSKREAELLNGILLGLTAKEIGAKYFITEKTVKFHTTKILKKSGYESRLRLLASYIQI